MNNSPHSARGRLGHTHTDSEPVFVPPSLPTGPNVIVILFDDLGFADLGCYGSEIPTPNIDALAAAGHRYNNFHTTTLCSPSRAALLTGRNHHAVGMRMLSNVDSGWPSGRGRITREAALVSEVLGDAGYNTFCTGKWHVAPMDEVTPAGPFGEWPLGRGFNQFYGFMNGATDHFYPELVHDNHVIPPPRRPAEGYHLTTDLIDRAAGYIADHIAQTPDRPFFHYLPLGASHTPHHAPAEYMERARGRYDEGWDVIRQRRYERQLELGIIPAGTALPPSNPNVPRWDTLTNDEQRVAARLQEAYAAMVEHTDHELGRLVDFLRTTGRLDDTMIVLTSDNGAAMEGGRLGAFSRIRFFNDMDDDFDRVLGRLDDIGGPLADSHYAVGWAQASNTPLKWYKFHTHGGGVRDPLIVHWGDHLARPGAILDQFHHITDITPTIYEITGVDLPGSYRGVPQMPLHGQSFAYTFSEPDAPTVRGPQYFEMFGNRAIWADGWKAVTYHEKGSTYSDTEWELYHVDEDFSESRNLATEQPERLRRLVEMWYEQAGRYDVLPLDDRSVELYRMPPKPGSPRRRRKYEYFHGTTHIEANTVPPFEHSPQQRVEADISGDKTGALVVYGATASGFALYCLDGSLHYEYNAAGAVTQLSLPLAPTDRQTVGFDFELDADERTGRVRLFVDSQHTDWTQIPFVLPFLSLSGMDIGRNSLSPISPRFDPPFEFAGTINSVVADLAPPESHHTQPLDD